jgi:hypothetical protein
MKTFRLFVCLLSAIDAAHGAWFAPVAAGRGVVVTAQRHATHEFRILKATRSF